MGSVTLKRTSNRFSASNCPYRWTKWHISFPERKGMFGFSYPSCTCDAYPYTPPCLGFWTLLNSLIRVRNKGRTFLWVWPVHPQESLCSLGTPAYSSPWQPPGCPQRHHQSLEETPGLCVCVSLHALQLMAWPEKGVSEFALVLPSFPTPSPLQHTF